MKITIVKPGFEILTPKETIATYQKQIERFARVCYKSEDRITDGSAEKLIRHLLQSKPNKHESVLEHLSISVLIICSRAASHQLVRHRIAAYSQESQRYCNYGKKGFAVICPPSISESLGGFTQYDLEVNRKDELNWWLALRFAEFGEYQRELDRGIPPEDARYNLPNAMKTEIVTTFNLRQWRHVFKLRALDNHAQWEIRGIMLGILAEFRGMMPDIFGFEND